MERTNPTMAHAMGRSAVALISVVVALIVRQKVVLGFSVILSW